MLRDLLAGFVAIVVVGGMARAQTVYGDGGTHTINGPSGPIRVENGTTVDVESPASITATDGNGGIYASDPSTVNISGGSIQGSTAVMSLGNIQITGGSLLGLAEFNPVTSRINPGVALNVSGAGPLPYLISGGTFEGQNGDLVGGVGAILSGAGNITGGAFIGDPAPPPLM